MRTPASLLRLLVSLAALGGMGACAFPRPTTTGPTTTGPTTTGPTSARPGSAEAADARGIPSRKACHVARPPPLFARRLRIDAATCVDVDGDLREWPALLETEGRETNAPKEPRRALAVELATDDAQLYLAARLRASRDASRQTDDEQIHVRFWFLDEGVHGTPLDLWLAIPRGRQGSGAVTEASGTESPERVPAARVAVQGSSDGFALEAAIPWSALPPSQRSPLGLRASVAYELPNGSAPGVAVGFGNPDGVLVPSPVEQSLLTDLDVDAARVSSATTRSWLDAGADFPYAADILSDERLERVGRMGGRVTICRTPGAGVSGRCQALDYGPEARIASIEAREVLGRGKKDLVVLYWRPTSTANHLLIDLLAPDEGQWLRSVFKHEVSVYMHCCASEGNAPPRIRSEVRLERGAIEIRAEEAWRLTEPTFKEPPVDGAFPLVRPWDNPARRRYVVTDGRIVPEAP